MAPIQHSKACCPSNSLKILFPISSLECVPMSSSDGNLSALNMWFRNTEAQWPRTVSPHQPLPGGGGRDLSSPSSSLEGKPLKEQWTRRARTTGQPPLNRADTSRDADTAKSASALPALHPATEVHNRPHLQVRRQAQGLTPRRHRPVAGSGHRRT